MKRMLLVASTALAFWTGACGSDDTKPVDSGTDATHDTLPSTDTVDPNACVGTFAGWTVTTLSGAVKAGGKCVAVGTAATPADLNEVCTGDVPGKASDAAKACLANLGPNDSAALLACFQAGLGSVVSISADCKTCYSNLVSCALASCKTECGSDPTTEACGTCLVNHGCEHDLFTCTGLPGEPAAPDGGFLPQADASTTPVDAAADTTAPVDAGVDAAAVDAATD